MAKGTADWQNAISILAQQASELNTRWKFGAAFKAEGEGTISPLATTTLITITGTGMLYGGFLHISGSASLKDGIPRLAIDGQIISAESWIDINDRNLNVENSLPIYLRKYDNTNFKYTAAFSQGITFESSAQFQYIELNNVIPTVKILVVYAVA